MDSNNTRDINEYDDILVNFVNDVVGWIPEFLGALVILIIGWIIAGLVATWVRRALNSARLNERLLTMHGGSLIYKAVPDVSGMLSTVVRWLIIFGALSLAVSVLGIDALTDFVGAIYSYIPNVLASIAIFLVAGAISAAVATLANNALGDTPTGRFVGSAAPIVIMSIAIFMILDQLGIAEQIVTITYAALIGGAMLSLALAFGLGGRDTASRMLESAYEAGLRAREQAKQDLKQAKSSGSKHRR